MASLIAHHFPIVRPRDAEKAWFNPVQKIRAADRPEERVRLRMVEFLVREAGFSPNRITTELPVKMQRDQTALRADILCFDEFLRPLLLIECKAESVRLDEKVAMQAAKYNSTIKAPYVMVTNGIRDLLFCIREDGSVEYVDDFRVVFPASAEPERSLEYWQERGFWGGVESGDSVGESPAKDASSPRDGLPADRARSVGETSTKDGLSPPRDAGNLYEALDQNAALSAYLSTLYTSPEAQNQYISVRVPEKLVESAGLPQVISHFMRVFPAGERKSRSALGFCVGKDQRTKLVNIYIDERGGENWSVGDVDVRDGVVVVGGVKVFKASNESPSSKTKNSFSIVISRYRNVEINDPGAIQHHPDKELLNEMLQFLE
jgi:hypothetical protein